MPFPVSNSTQPFWRTEPHAFDTHRSSTDLPSEADVVVIGSGFSGTAIVHHLLEKSKASSAAPSITVLEAREACSGATGRNGGHLKPDPYYRASSALRAHGKDLAEEVASFEARQVQELKQLVERESIDCDFVITRACDVCLYSEAHRDLKERLDELSAAGVSTASEVFYAGEKNAEGVSGIQNAKACFTYTASHVWPYRLVLHLLGKAVSQGVNLQTRTPVHSVEPIEPYRGPRRWAVQTARGSIQTSKVIYATNAYTSALLPEFKNQIVPVRGICSRIVPTKARLPHLSNNYILRLAPGEFDYLIPRSDGSIIVGGARRDYYRDLKEWYDIVDDSKLIESAKYYFDGYMQRHFQGWEDSGAATDQIWTVMGYSSDGFPHVGEVPGKPGQYICAGFTGHGMSQIYLSAKALAVMIVHGQKVEDLDLPTLYRASQDRLNSKQNITLEAWEAVYPKNTDSGQ